MSYHIGACGHLNDLGDGPLIRIGECTRREREARPEARRPVETAPSGTSPPGEAPDYFERLGAAVEEIGRSRWLLEQVVALADDAPRLSDAELRARLAALAGRARLVNEGGGSVPEIRG